jgi:hypothetical protein
MSFGNATVFPFPAVQYIPLPLTVLRQNRFAAPGSQTLPLQLLIGPETKDWQQKVGVPPPAGEDRFAILPDHLLILALNLQIDDAKYRGHLVTMLGKANPGCYQLAALPCQYFYKDTIFFELYDNSTSRRLARSGKWEVK